jgi:predicted acylesterase/phospholipase RssA
VYQALAEVDLHPKWVAGISIGAINSVIIAGNPPEDRVAKLRAFWEGITSDPLFDWTATVDLLVPKGDKVTRRLPLVAHGQRQVQPELLCALQCVVDELQTEPTVGPSRAAPGKVLDDDLTIVLL